LPIHPAEILEGGRVRGQDPRHDALASGITDRVLTDREGLEQRGVRVLIRSRHHADLPDHPLLIDLARCAVIPRPLGGGPAPDPLLVGEWHLVVLAVVLPGLFHPALLDDLDGFLVDLPIVLINRGAIHWRTGDVVLLPEYVHPAVLVSPREAGVEPPLRQLVEDGKLFRSPDRIPSGKNQAQRGKLDPPRSGGTRASCRYCLAAGAGQFLGEDLQA